MSFDSPAGGEGFSANAPSRAAGKRALKSDFEVLVMSSRSKAFPEATILRRINRALADSGLRVRTTRRSALTADAAVQYYIVYGSRTFRLRVEIDELARSLGIFDQHDMAELRQRG
jgi:hypothetical protein